MNIKSIFNLDFLNHSGEVQRKAARDKFFLHFLVVSVVYLYIELAVPHGSIWFVVGWLSFLYVFPKFIGRFVVSWNGMDVKNAKFGFAVCDRCRKLKPARQIEQGSFGNMVICTSDAPFIRDYFSGQEARRNLEAHRVSALVEKFPKNS